MNSFFVELKNVALFLQAVGQVLLFTGAGLGWLVAYGYERSLKRRMP